MANELQARRSVVDWLNNERIEAEIKRALPDHVPLEWFMRCAQTAILNNPDLAMADRETLLRELVAIAQLGLVTDPQLGEAWLIIDRHKKVQRRIGYQGLRRLALQSGEVTALNAQAAYENDACSIRLGDKPRVKHKINIGNATGRGKVLGCYAVARVKGTKAPIVEWMSWEEIDKHRKRYSDAYRGGFGPWADELGQYEMARKTVFRRLVKWLPKSPMLARELSHDDHLDEQMREINERPPRIEPPQPTVAPLVVELFDADGTGYRLQPGEIEGWAARQATDATPDQLDQLLEHNRGAAAHVLALIETAIQNEINRRGGGDPEPRPSEAHQQPTAVEPPRPATKRPAPAGEPPAGSGPVTWRGKSYPERPGYAVRMALETLNQCGDWGAVVRVKSEVESLIAQLRAVEHPGAEQVAKALADAEEEFERPANDDDDGPEYSDEGEPEPETTEEDTAEAWLAAALAKIDGAPALGHLRVYARQLREEAEKLEFDAGVVAQLNAALEAKEKALSGA